MGCFVILFTPCAIHFTELAVLIRLTFLIPASLDVLVPLIDKRHVLSGLKLMIDHTEIRQFVTQVAAGCGRGTIDQLGNTIVGDPFRQWIAKCFALLEGPQEVIDSRLAVAEGCGDLTAFHAQGVVLCNDVFVIQHSLSSSDGS